MFSFLLLLSFSLADDPIREDFLANVTVIQSQYERGDIPLEWRNMTIRDIRAMDGLWQVDPAKSDVMDPILTHLGFGWIKRRVLRYFHTLTRIDTSGLISNSLCRLRFGLASNSSSDSPPSQSTSVAAQLISGPPTATSSGAGNFDSRNRILDSPKSGEYVQGSKIKNFSAVDEFDRDRIVHLVMRDLRMDHQNKKSLPRFIDENEMIWAVAESSLSPTDGGSGLAAGSNVQNLNRREEETVYNMYVPPDRIGLPVYVVKVKKIGFSSNGTLATKVAPSLLPGASKQFPERMRVEEILEKLMTNRSVPILGSALHIRPDTLDNFPINEHSAAKIIVMPDTKALDSSGEILRDLPGPGETKNEIRRKRQTEIGLTEVASRSKYTEPVDAVSDLRQHKTTLNSVLADVVSSSPVSSSIVRWGEVGSSSKEARIHRPDILIATQSEPGKECANTSNSIADVANATDPMISLIAELKPDFVDCLAAGTDFTTCSRQGGIFGSENIETDCGSVRISTYFPYNVIKSGTIKIGGTLFDNIDSDTGIWTSTADFIDGRLLQKRVSNTYGVMYDVRAVFLTDPRGLMPQSPVFLFRWTLVPRNALKAIRVDRWSHRIPA